MIDELKMSGAAVAIVNALGWESDGFLGTGPGAVTGEEISYMMSIGLEDIPLFLARGAHVPSGCTVGSIRGFWYRLDYWELVVVPYLSKRMELGV